MKVDEDEYLLQSSNNSISMTCEGDDPDDGDKSFFNDLFKFINFNTFKYFIVLKTYNNSKQNYI